MNHFLKKVSLVCVVFLAACKQPSRLEQALRLAGDHRKELEQVIEHYSNEERDSLKRKAAVFLIENMPGHYAVAGEAVEKQKERVDSIYRNVPAFIRQYAYGLPTRKTGEWQEHDTTKDIETLSAAFLIESIDEAFEAWETCPWLEGLSFADFCDFVLPYRKLDEPLIFKKSERDTLWKELRSIVLRYADYRPVVADFKRLYREREWEKTVTSFKGGCFEESYITALYRKQEERPFTYFNNRLRWY